LRRKKVLVGNQWLSAKPNEIDISVGFVIKKTQRQLLIFVLRKKLNDKNKHLYSNYD
jgi:hypothetical protein